MNNITVLDRHLRHGTLSSSSQILLLLEHCFRVAIVFLLLKSNKNIEISITSFLLIRFVHDLLLITIFKYYFFVKNKIYLSLYLNIMMNTWIVHMFWDLPNWTPHSDIRSNTHTKLKQTTPWITDHLYHLGFFHHSPMCMNNVKVHQKQFGWQFHPLIQFEIRYPLK